MGWEPKHIYWEFENKFIWRTRGENCPYCDIMEGRVYELDTYITSSVYPGFHQGCDCYLQRVPQDTPVSDLDIFGSALNMRNNAWIEALWGKDNLYRPLWKIMVGDFLNFAKPGMTAREAMSLLKESEEKNTFGMFKDMGFPGNIFYPWNVYRNVSKMYFIPTKSIITSFIDAKFKPHSIWPNPKSLTSSNPMNNITSYLSRRYIPTSSIITSLWGANLKPARLKPRMPAQSYHDTIYNSRWAR